MNCRRLSLEILSFVLAAVMLASLPAKSHAQAFGFSISSGGGHHHHSRTGFWAGYGGYGGYGPYWGPGWYGPPAVIYAAPPPPPVVYVQPTTPTIVTPPPPPVTPYTSAVPAA